MKTKGQRGETITIGGCFILIIAGVLLLNASGSDTSGILLPIGIIFLFGGIIGGVALIIRFITH